MSVQALTWVLENSQAEHGARLVAISLANHAGTDGGDSYPSIPTIAKESRLGASTVRVGITRLLDLGEIVEEGVSRYGTRVFRFTFADPSESGPPQNLDPPQNAGGTPSESAPEPSREPSVESPSGSIVGSEVEQLCRLLAERVRDNGYSAPPADKPLPVGWVKAMDRLLRLDRDPTTGDPWTVKQVAHVIEWASLDEFWQQNVRSPDKLRKQFETLVGRIKREARGGGSARVAKVNERIRAFMAEAERLEADGR